MANWSKTFDLAGVKVRFTLPEDSSRRIWRGTWEDGFITLWKNPRTGMWEANLYSGEVRIVADDRTMESAATYVMAEWLHNHKEGSCTHP